MSVYIRDTSLVAMVQLISPDVSHRARKACPAQHQARQAAVIAANAGKTWCWVTWTSLAQHVRMELHVVGALTACQQHMSSAVILQAVSDVSSATRTAGQQRRAMQCLL